MDVAGELTDQGTHWQFVYDDCRHVQEFARLELEDAQVRDDPQRAALEVKRHYARCLSCRVNQRTAAL
jgi:hypothetical protein